MKVLKARLPKVTVYLPSHNYGRFLEQSIESVLRQSMDGWELLLIDDGSSDDSREIFRMYEGDPRVKVFETGGIGLPAVANLALRNAKGEYLIRLDGDDVFDENILLVLANHLDRNPRAALVFPDYFLMDESGRVFGQERKEQVHFRNHVLDVPAHGACTMVRRGILEKLGGYREDLGAQDGFDLWTRLTREHRCSNVNIPLFYYRRHGENLTNDSHRILNARRAIKRDASVPEIAKLHPIVAVIPCRKLYDTHPDLWNQRLNGVTLLGKAIENCISSPLFDRIVVTSDNPAVKETMSRYRDKRLVYIHRPTEETLRSRPIALTLERVNRELGIGNSGISVLNYIQAPFATTQTLEEAVYTLAMNRADSSFAVNEVTQTLFRRTEHGLEPLNQEKGFRSDFDTIYSEARISLALRNENLRTGSLTGRKIVNFAVSPDEAFFIQSDRDLQIARIMYRQLKHDTNLKKIA